MTGLSKFGVLGRGKCLFAAVERKKVERNHDFDIADDPVIRSTICLKLN
jgi:hypothetical protein